MPVKWNASRRFHASIFDAIGRTPLVQLNRIPAAAGVKAKILVKVEYFSPSGSLKDRIYYNMFTRAEKRGALKKGMTILECSTGNAGIGCSFVSAVKGYPCIIVMPEGMSEERKKLDIAYGAPMVYTPGGESDVDLALEKLEEIRRKNPKRYFVPAQFDNPDNIDAHVKTTAPEIWEQTAREDRRVHHDAGHRRHAHRRRAVHPQAEEGAASCSPSSRPSARCCRGARGARTASRASATASCRRTSTSASSNGIVTTTTDESMEMARRLAKEEGIFCGISSGANVAGAIKLAKAHPELKTIVTLICDTGQRYFSTELCGMPKHVEIPEREHPMDPYTTKQLDKYQKRWEIID